ncbi:ECF-type sigma factor [Qipengyuania mesophila]|uniref:RNA polymerase subunit sigma n=1 Tax=Qipengyuania mesophila TaxID=2867246 RepID=A0ABS7JXR3_9SPHN|nr:ECF-type sigma factor [Qipengyuania mesophila]MBX7502442.1 RNA polymerase subunit sigma [Qipengyuania mesophila]
MTSHAKTEVLILAWREGDDESRNRLIARLLPSLEEIAAARLRREGGTSLSTHELINEAVERLIAHGGESLVGRAHMIALSSRLMRNILVDRARAMSAAKRQHRRVELNTRVAGTGPLDLYELDSALIRLRAIEPELMEVVEMRYFGGMTLAEIAEVTDWSEATVKRRWQVARAWLADALNPALKP